MFANPYPLPPAYTHNGLAVRFRNLAQRGVTARMRALARHALAIVEEPERKDPLDPRVKTVTRVLATTSWEDEFLANHLACYFGIGFLKSSDPQAPGVALQGDRRLVAIAEEAFQELRRGFRESVRNGARFVAQKILPLDDPLARN